MLNTNTSYIIIYETNKLIKRMTFVESYSANKIFMQLWHIFRSTIVVKSYLIHRQWTDLLQGFQWQIVA